MARTGHIPACKPLRGNQDPGLCIQALSGYGQDRYIQACNIHSQPMLPGLCTQGLAIPAQDRPTTGDTGILEQASTP